MKRQLLILILLIFCSLRTLSAEDVSFPQGAFFVENKGQETDQENRAVNSVLYSIRQPGLTVYLTESGLTYLFFEPEKEKEEDELNFENNKTEYRYERFDLELSGASISKKQISESKPGPFTLNFYCGSTQTQVTGLNGFQHLLVKDIYPGIDWSLSASADGSGLKYDFIVHPGADPSQIRLLYRGKSPVVFPDSKTVRFKTKIGGLTDRVPLAYAGEEKNEISVSYQLFSDEKKGSARSSWHETEFGFSLGKYASSAILVIDPAQLWWGTYFGGNGVARGHSLTCDYNNNLVFAGELTQANFPVYNPGNNAYFQGTIAGNVDAILAQFSSSGVLLWCTLFGGSQADRLQEIEVLPNNQLITAGYSYSTDVITLDPGNGAYFQPAMAGVHDGLILRFSSSGVLLWSTYWGSGGTEKIESMAVNAQGYTFLTGTAGTNPAMQPVNPGGAYQQNFGGVTDAFVMRITPSSAIDWFTYLGGSLSETGKELDVAPSGEIAIMGSTGSLNLPVVSPAQSNDFYQPVYGGGTDVFLARFTPSCSLEWCTYLGGSALETSLNILFDHHSELLVAGTTTSSNFTYVNPGNGAYFSNTGAAFIARFSDSLEMKWSTQINMNGNIANGFGLAIGPCDQYYLSGLPGTSPNMLLNPGNGAYYRSTIAGGPEIFLMEFNNNDQLKWGTYWGGAGTDDGMVLTVDQSGAIYATGDAGGLLYTSATVGTFQNNCLANPGGGAYYQNLPGIYSDYNYITKFNPVPDPIATLAAAIVYSNPSCPAYNDGNITLSPSGGVPAYSIEWLPGNQNDTALNNLSPGTYLYTLEDSRGCMIRGSVSLGQDQPYDIHVLGSPLFICEGDSAILTASGAPSYTWQPGSLSGNTITVVPAQTTTYIASYTDANGCISSDSVRIGVTPYPQVTITGDSVICYGSSAQITMAGAYGLDWLNINQVSNPVTYPFPNDTLIYAVGINAPGCSDTAAFFIDVIQPQISITGQDTACDSTTIYASSQNAGTILWSTGANGNSILVTQSGVYTATVTDTNGCEATASMNITIIDCKPLSANENQTGGFSIWPNPVSGNVNIDLPDGKIWALEVIDSRGRIILQTKVQGPNTTLNSSGWADGIYLLRFSNEKETHEMQLVKQAKK